MKRIILAAGLTMMPLAAPAQGLLHIEAGGGMFIPRGDSARFAENGYRAGLGVELKPWSNLGFLLDGAYNHNKVDGNEVKEANSLPPGFSVKGDAQIRELSLSPKFYLRDQESLSAYVMAGGGPRWLRKKTTISPPSGAPVVKESSEQSLGLQFGFGVEAAVTEAVRVGINPLYHLVLAKDREIRYFALMVYVKI